MIEVKPDLAKEEDEFQKMVDKVFFKVIDLLGGIKKLAEFRSLTWLPSLARAVYAVILKEEYLKSDEEIAERLGLATNTVKTMLRANIETALIKIKQMEEGEEVKKDLRIHTAGALAKYAYKLFKEQK